MDNFRVDPIMMITAINNYEHKNKNKNKYRSSDEMKRKFVCLTNKDKAEELADEGFNYMLETLDSNQVIYKFILTDELYRVLNDKKRFNKREWYYDSKMRF